MLNSISKFAYEWYFVDSKGFWGGVIKFIKIMDRDFGVVANVYNWTSPLYGDYSYIGRAIGPLFRTFRILVGLAFYAAIFLFALFLYALWLVLPLLVAAMVIVNLLDLFKQI